MHKNLLVVALCVLTTVNLCGTENSSAPVPTTALGTTEGGTSSTDAPTTNRTEEPQTEAPHTNATTILPETPNPTGNTTEMGGLSGGAIAGITIGSIAGVGLLGGGVFGLLKYTGKI